MSRAMEAVILLAEDIKKPERLPRLFHFQT